MSGTDQTFHYTKEDVRKMESKQSHLHGGNVPAGSEAAKMQSLVDKANKDKSEIIAERQANLPLPEQPPRPSDWNSADASTVNVGSGGVSDTFSHGSDSLREPATGDSSVRTDGEAFKTNTLGDGVGRQGHDGLGGLPNDAVAREAKGKPGIEDTTKKDYGYPHKSDPSSGL
ncbi:hypothetical protein LTR66_005214 [Elasticomyces elasticus]|nr:hypothetical protein LTR66_005214 [Elasticomyces elasticus]KAK5010654.1 hypothetical protein LTR28_008523 [Elasticomyces elasticus]